MEIYHLTGNSLRFKSKRSTLIVDPSSSITKTPADSIISTQYQKEDNGKVTDFRMSINAPGEYEVGGIKISGLKVDDNISYNLFVDDIDVIISKNTTLQKASDKYEGCDVLVLDCDSDINQSVVTALEPRVLILYGEKAKEAAKAMGKEAQTANKYAVTKDKLPEELELVILG